jgi:DNA-binding transcriptional LysR family regulator
MNLNDLRYFALIVEHGGYTAAERVTQLHRSKLSRRIAELEASLGVRLLQRTTRRLALTEAGRVFYEHCAAMMVEAEAAKAAVDMLRSEPVGTVRISCPVVLAQLYVAKLIASFMIDNPKVRVELDAVDRAVNLIEERIDIALRVRASAFNDPGVVSRQVAVGRFVLVASPAYLSAREPIETPGQLSTHDTIGALQEGAEQTWTLNSGDVQGTRIVARPRMLCSDLGIQLQAAISGVGVALLPRRIVATGLKYGALVQVLPEWGAPEESINLVYASRRGMLPSVRALSDYLLAHLPTTLGQ